MKLGFSYINLDKAEIKVGVNGSSFQFLYVNSLKRFINDLIQCCTVTNREFLLSINAVKLEEQLG